MLYWVGFLGHNATEIQVQPIDPSVTAPCVILLLHPYHASSATSQLLKEKGKKFKINGGEMQIYSLKEIINMENRKFTFLKPCRKEPGIKD